MNLVHLSQDSKYTFNENNQLTNTMKFELNHLIAIIAGICILILPNLLNYIVAGYLILIGLVGIINTRSRKI